MNGCIMHLCLTLVDGIPEELEASSIGGRPATNDELQKLFLPYRGLFARKRVSNQLDLWDLNTKLEQQEEQEKTIILNGLLNHLILNQSCLSAVIILVDIYYIAVYNKMRVNFQILAGEVVLQDIDVSSALIYYIKKNSVGNIVAGGSSRNLLTRFFFFLSVSYYLFFRILMRITNTCTFGDCLHTGNSEIWICHRAYSNLHRSLAQYILYLPKEKFKVPGQQQANLRCCLVMP